jgi:pimeloyl-ACP methyl ester carboxylesterase
VSLIAVIALFTALKQFIWFEKSGHFPFFEEKEKFEDQLVQRVLPLASP